MSTILYVSLFTTLLYLYLTIDNTLYQRNIVITTIVLALVLGLWAYYFSDSVILSVAIGFITIFVVYARYKVIGNENGTEIVIHEEQKTPVNPMDGFNGKTGNIIQPTTMQNYYLGNVNMGTLEKPLLKTIVVYSEDKLEYGEPFEITGVDGTKIKVIKK